MLSMSLSLSARDESTVNWFEDPVRPPVPLPRDVAQSDDRVLGKVIEPQSSPSPWSLYT